MGAKEVAREPTAVAAAEVEATVLVQGGAVREAALEVATWEVASLDVAAMRPDVVAVEVAEHAALELVAAAAWVA